jgi:hypothetical protein
MAQQLLDPDKSKITPTGSWKPSGPIPADVRAFGYFPNIDDWLPGDLLLVSASKPGWVSRQIISAQSRGGYSPDDARWHHAAMYIGDAHICEAVGRGVHAAPMFEYIGGHLLRVRRDSQLSAEARFRLAIKALTRMRNSYSRGSVFKLFFQSFKGFWGDSDQPFAPLGIRAVICSQLYADAYAMATSKLITSTPTVQVTPAALSETALLVDVPVRWHSIGT